MKYNHNEKKIKGQRLYFQVVGPPLQGNHRGKDLRQLITSYPQSRAESKGYMQGQLRACAHLGFSVSYSSGDLPWGMAAHSSVSLPTSTNENNSHRHVHRPSKCRPSPQ